MCETWKKCTNSSSICSDLRESPMIIAVIALTTPHWNVYVIKPM